MSDFRIDLANLFNGLSARIHSELFTTPLEVANVRMEQIVSHGGTSHDDFCIR